MRMVSGEWEMGSGKARAGQRAIGTLALVWVLLMSAGSVQAGAGESIQALHRDWMAPRAVEFTAASEGLTHALEAYCGKQDASVTLDQPRQAWRTALDRWERFSAVAIGPVLEQRMQRRIDFMPTRPRLILKAINSAPATAKDMELIGTPAKGLPALEWLLWTQPVQPATPACAYAQQVAKEIGAEARGMEQGYRQAAGRVLTAEAAKAALSELVNQWVGGLERLRWANMEMPLRVAGTAGPEAAPEYPRQASGTAAAGWAAQWDLLRALAVGRGKGSLAGLLREQGNADLADVLVRTAAGTDAAMAGLAATDKDRVLAAARALADLKRLVEDPVATALGVSMGFSDSDGD